MIYRCRSERAILETALRQARNIYSSAPRDAEWADVSEPFQCCLGETEHDFHAAFLRDLPGDLKQVFFCWTDEADIQWLIPRKICAKTRTSRGAVCTIFRDHPGLCEWGYIDPVAIAAEAEADQRLAALNKRLGFTPKDGLEALDWEYNQPPTK